MAAAIVPCETTPSAADELARCSCGKEMKTPKLLDCLHVLGSCCVTLQDNSKVVACTVCGAETKVAERQLQMLPDPNFLLLIVAEEQKALGKKPACEQCSSPAHDATGRCQQCAQFVCEKAKEVHELVPFLKDHDIVDLDQFGEDSSASVESICRKHKQLLQFYCGQHGEPLCSTCKLEHHASCSNTNLDDQMKIVVSLLKTTEEQLTASNQPVRNAIQGGAEVKGSTFQQAAAGIEEGLASYLRQEEFLLRRTRQLLKSGSKEEQVLLYKLLSKARKILPLWETSIAEGNIRLYCEIKPENPVHVFCIDTDRLTPAERAKYITSGALVRRQSNYGTFGLVQSVSSGQAVVEMTRTSCLCCVGRVGCNGNCKECNQNYPYFLIQHYKDRPCRFSSKEQRTFPVSDLRLCNRYVPVERK